MFYFWGVILDLDKYFPMVDVFYPGGHLRLESFCIRKNTVVAIT